MIQSWGVTLLLSRCNSTGDGFQKQDTIAKHFAVWQRDGWEWVGPQGGFKPSTGPRFPYGTTVTWAYSRLGWPHWTSWPLSQATKAEARTSACTNHSQREEPLSNASLTQSPKGKVDGQDSWTQYDGCIQLDNANFGCSIYIFCRQIWLHVHGLIWLYDFFGKWLLHPQWESAQKSEDLPQTILFLVFPLFFMELRSKSELRFVGQLWVFTAALTLPTISEIGTRELDWDLGSRSGNRIPISWGITGNWCHWNGGPSSYTINSI